MFKVPSAAIPLQFADPTDARFGLSVVLLAPGNQPPVFTSAAIAQTTVGTPYSYQATATDPNGDSLTFQAAPPPISTPRSRIVQQRRDHR